jgi:excinuclease ABC subunit C
MDSPRASGPGSEALLTSEERAGRTGPEIIKDNVKRLPSKPGVYRMLDRAGDVLYVGKARNLKARVENYVRLGGHTARIARMIADTAAMEFTVVATETEALLLEANLIKRLKPRYNITLRDDKSFPYILIRRDHPAPQVMKHRGARAKEGDYFGPFASAKAVARTINTLQKAFLIRSCTDSVYENRTRPCMLYQIKRCSAPCVGYVSLEQHAALVDDAKAFLSGQSDELRKRLQTEMQAAAEALQFETAARLRDRIRALAPITTSQGVNPEGVEEADVIGVHQEGGQTCVEVVFIRAGQNWGDRAFFPRHEKEADCAAVLEAFIAQFYDDKPIPRCIFVSHEPGDCALLQEALSLKAGRRIEIHRPQRGEKTRLVEHARRNAQEALARKLAESASQARLLEGVAHALDLPEPPRRIEVYDNSHIQGAKAVGAMIVSGPEGLDRSAYRKWNIKSEDLAPGDDYGMMREVLRRRFARLLKEAGQDGASLDDQSPSEDHQPRHPGRSPGESRGEEPGPGEQPEVSFSLAMADQSPGTPDPGSPLRGVRDDVEMGYEVDHDVPAEDRRRGPNWPDLVLLDGGQGQLAAALETLAELGLSPADVNLVAIAKGPDRDAGRETFFRPGRPPMKLEPTSPVLYFLQRLRDEAHRFAIEAHRTKRAQDVKRNPLDEIPGVGASRKKALLAHFGSARAVSRASLDDLENVPGVSKQLARRVYEWFQDAG